MEELSDTCIERTRLVSMDYKQEIDDLINHFACRERCYNLDDILRELDGHVDKRKKYESHRLRLARCLKEIAVEVSERIGAAHNILIAGFGERVSIETAEEELADNAELEKALGTNYDLFGVDVQPDVWFKISQFEHDMPLLLMEIVSGSGEDAFRQTLRKSVCNTIEHLRFFRNVKVSGQVSSVSSIVFPNSKSKKTCGCIKVTADWGREQTWEFSMKLSAIPKERVGAEIKTVLSTNYALLQDDVLPFNSNYLVRLTDLPQDMTQIPTPHSLVIRQARTNGGYVILKFSPRCQYREWLLYLLWKRKNGSIEDVASIKPKTLKDFRGIVFHEFDAILEPLNRSQLISCYGHFVQETAVQLKNMHVREKIAHLDIRTFNVGYYIDQGREKHPEQPVVRAMFIDLDRGCSVDEKVPARSTLAQYQKPPEWPANEKFTAGCCDWRQWALMVWALLEDGDSVYSGRLQCSGMPFIDNILFGKVVNMDGWTDEELSRAINCWLQEDERILDLKGRRPEFDSKTLADVSASCLLKCLLPAVTYTLVYGSGLHRCLPSGRAGRNLTIATRRRKAQPRHRYRPTRLRFLSARLFHLVRSRRLCPRTMDRPTTPAKEKPREAQSWASQHTSTTAASPPRFGSPFRPSTERQVGGRI